MVHSFYQKNIFNFVKDGFGHAVIEAVAGSGKTTTIVEALNYIPSNTNNLYLAFNKHIADELQTRVPFNTKAQTLHSLGYELCRKELGKLWVDNNKVYKLLKACFNWKCAEDRDRCYKYSKVVQKVVGLMKSSSDKPDIEVIAAQHGVELTPDLKNITELVFAKSIQDKKSIDFNDMLYYPVMNFLNIRQNFDFIFVDEAQDLSDIQMKFILKLMCDKTRVIAVGDTKQAIYGFRGAGVNTMELLTAKLSATNLPLSVCYRCCKHIVREARLLVPHIEHFDDNEDGRLYNATPNEALGKVKSGDFVLCRTTAKLVNFCMKLAKRGTATCIKGKELGTMMRGFIENLGVISSDTTEMLLQKLTMFSNNKLSKVNSYERIFIDDQIDAIRFLAEGSKSVLDVMNSIEKMFIDDPKNCVVCMTIHKAKGLETDNVWLLHPEMIPHPKCELDWQIKQEMNLKYVAITRAKKQFVYVKESQY